jgi:hypothetical protein
LALETGGNMDRTELYSRLDAIRARVEVFERFIKIFSDSLLQPIMYHSAEAHYGFRYLKPGLEHFCLLKGARAVSALNAAIELARLGYTQEIAVLIRTIIEYTTHIDYVLAGMPGEGAISEGAGAYIRDYFADFKRNSREDYKKASVRQHIVHEKIGAALDDTSSQPDLSAEKLLSNVYLAFSNYVHAKYPETMDMYGGEPARFDLHGMNSASKNAENVAYIETFEVTVSQALARTVLGLKLKPIIEKDDLVNRWYISVVT